MSCVLCTLCGVAPGPVVASQKLFEPYAVQCIGWSGIYSRISYNNSAHAGNQFSPTLTIEQLLIHIRCYKMQKNRTHYCFIKNDFIKFALVMHIRAIFCSLFMLSYNSKKMCNLKNYPKMRSDLKLLSNICEQKFS